MKEYVSNLFAQSSIDVTSLPQVGADSNKISTVFNIVIAIVASVAVLIIVLAGFKYITSSGDAQGVAAARKAIVYALVGLVVCALAWAIVTFVVNGV